jgi:hypothetical protein
MPAPHRESERSNAGGFLPRVYAGTLMGGMIPQPAPAKMLWRRALSTHQRGSKIGYCATPKLEIDAKMAATGGPQWQV